MRLILSIIAIITTVLALFKWRYKILNAILGINVLRKLTISVAMRIPSIRHKAIPSLFSIPKDK